MGNKQSRVTPVPLDVAKGFIPSNKSCTFPDTTILDRRIYQLQLIDRACEIINRTLRNATRTSEYVSAQSDALNYKDARDIDDPEFSMMVKGTPVKYRYHQWSILTDDKDLVAYDRRNPFKKFEEPLDGNQPVDVVRPTWMNYLKVFNEVKENLLKALRRECVTK